MIRRGYEFTHDRVLDETWKPGPGQKYADAPKARMVVTRVTASTVWYGFAGDDHAGWRLDRAVFERRFGA